jgi:hypothetical protein
MSQDKPTMKSEPSNAGASGTDTDPGEQHGKAEKVTTADLKGKKVDADPDDEQQQPAERNASEDEKSPGE